MKDIPIVYLLPIIAALIGWLTNWIAVKMLFHPRKPILGIQGIFPKRQSALAEKLADVVATELLTSNDLVNTIKNALKDKPEKLQSSIGKIVTEVLPEKFPLLAMVLTPEVSETISKVFTDSFSEIAGELFSGLNIGDQHIRKTVKDKVVNFSSDKLEQILFSIMKKEFKFIELIGAVLGFFIGLVQVLLISL